MSTENQSKLILLVEDDEAFRLRLSKALQKRGYRIKSASSVAEGLDAVKESVPDYAVIDLRLKDGSGLEVIEALEKKCRGTRTVILTGYGNIPTAVADEIITTLVAPEGSQPAAPTNPIAPDDARWEHIVRVYHEAGENVSETARLLQMHRRTLQLILRRNSKVKNAA